MRSRANCIGAAIAILITSTACVAETRQTPSPTPLPSTPTPIPLSSTPQLPTDTPAPPTAEPTAAPIAMTTFEEMAGVYYRDGKTYDLKLRINLDGSAYLTLIGSTTYPQEYWFEDGLLHVREDVALSDDCAAGLVGIYEVSGVPGQRISFSFVEDPCKSDRQYSGTWTSDPIE